MWGINIYMFKMYETSTSLIMVVSTQFIKPPLMTKFSLSEPCHYSVYVSFHLFLCSQGLISRVLNQIQLTSLTYLRTLRKFSFHFPAYRTWPASQDSKEVQLSLSSLQDLACLVFVVVGWSLPREVLSWMSIWCLHGCLVMDVCCECLSVPVIMRWHVGMSRPHSSTSQG